MPILPPTLLLEEVRPPASRIVSKSKSTEDTANWTSERRTYRQLLQKERESFWKQKMDAEKSSPRQLWRPIDALIGRSRAPEGCDTINAQQFHHHFEAKFVGLRTATDGPPIACYTQFHQSVAWSTNGADFYERTIKKQ